MAYMLMIVIRASLAKYILFVCNLFQHWKVPNDITAVSESMAVDCLGGWQAGAAQWFYTPSMVQPQAQYRMLTLLQLHSVDPHHAQRTQEGEVPRQRESSLQSHAGTEGTGFMTNLWSFVH